MRLFHTFRFRTTFKVNSVDNSVDKLSNECVFCWNNFVNLLFLFVGVLILILDQYMIFFRKRISIFRE